MTQRLVEALLQVAVVLPLVVLALEERKRASLKVVLVFVLFFVGNKALLSLPIVYDEARVIEGNWNWAGKIYAILGSVVFLFFYKKYHRADYFLTWKQNSTFKHRGFAVVLAIFIIGALINLIFPSPMVWNSETLLFQLTMPGLDEEIAYRGIMLGLLSNTLKKDLWFFGVRLGAPAIWISSILFGLVHGLMISPAYELYFYFEAFLTSLLYGLVWAWLTLKSGSILFSLISHNLANTALYVIRMLN
ncbi:MAG: CPBP family intramembrane glutamic endopeptidase [Bacteroidota bacterium]